MLNLFKRKPKKIVTTNKLCIQLTETAMATMAEELYSAFHRKEAPVVRKKTHDKYADLFDTLLESFSKEVHVRFPWIARWKLVEKRLATTHSEYFIEVDEHTIDDCRLSV